MVHVMHVRSQGTCIPRGSKKDDKVSGDVSAIDPGLDQSISGPDNCSSCNPQMAPSRNSIFGKLRASVR